MRVAHVEYKFAVHRGHKKFGAVRFPLDRANGVHVLRRTHCSRLLCTGLRKGTSAVVATMENESNLDVPHVQALLRSRHQSLAVW